jgi:hypothetical protein
MKDLHNGTTFYIGTSTNSKFILNQKFWKSKSDLDFRKLNEIAKNRLKT